MTFLYRAKTDVIFKAPKLENPRENNFYSLKKDETVELPTQLNEEEYLKYLELEGD
mgnify:CR=1 FL=1